MTGGAGNDRLTGGSGEDVFEFETFASAGTDTVTDFTDGVDVILFDGGSFGDLTITASGTSVLITSTSGGNMVLQNTSVGDIAVDDFIFS